MGSDGNRKKAGRPSKFDEVAAKTILGALANGAWRRTAATIAGIDYTTLKRWIRKGLKQPAGSPLGDFARNVPKAEAGCEFKLTQQIFQIIGEIHGQGTTVLLVEQNAQMALNIAHRGYVLQTGRIILADTAANLAANEQVRQAYLGEI